MTDHTILDTLTRSRFTAILICVLGVCLLWAYWPTLVGMGVIWMQSPRYSHGFLVPGFALFLLWARRGLIAEGLAPPSWWGLPLILAGALIHFAGAYVYYEWFQGLSLLLSLAGLAVTAGGWPALRWSLPSIAFLFFMIPLPYRLEQALGYPLQRTATVISTFCLQTLGLPAVAEGNTILMNHARIGVVEACNGLGMMFMFLAFATAVTLVVNRPLIDKMMIILSAAPIAVAANVVRITVTGLLHETVGGKVADAVYHDLAGWLLMPLALGALWVELQILSHLFLEANPKPVGLMPIHFVGSARTDVDRLTGGRRTPGSR